MLYGICLWPYESLYGIRYLKDGEFGLLLNVAKVSTFICIYLYHEVNMNYVRPVGVNSC